MGMMLEDTPASEDLSVKPPGFWRRQFMPAVTKRQVIFDVIVGIVAPVLCLIFDPAVFKTGWPVDCFLGGHGVGGFGEYRIFATLAVSLGIVSLLLWLTAGRYLRQWVSFMGGILLAGALFSLVVGVAIVPLSVLGLLALFWGYAPGIIGILGFMPFLTAFVYLRNGVRAIWCVTGILIRRKAWLIAGALAGAFVVLVIPVAAQREIDRLVFGAIEGVLSSDSRLAEQGELTLKSLCSICPSCYLQYTTRYLVSINKGTDTIFPKDDRLDAIYKEVTGKDIRECPLFGP